MGKLKKLFTGAGMLAAAMVAAKLIGVLYRIPLTNILGSEGMGLYQMVFPFYTLLLTVSGGGLPAAISRTVAVRLARGDERGADRALWVSMAAFSLVGLLGALVVFLLAAPLASAQGNDRAAAAYAGIAPAILFVAVIACFRGFFQGRQNMLPSAVSQLTEQLVKLILGLFLAALLLPRGLEWGVLGALLGISISEAAALLALFLLFLTTRGRNNRRAARQNRRAALFESAGELDPLRPTSDISVISTGAVRARAAERAGRRAEAESVGQLLKGLLRIALPVTFGSLILPVTQVVDSMLIINLLVGAGTGVAGATSLYGLYNGIVMTIIHMPVVVVSAFSVALMPRLTRLKETDKDLRPEIAYNLKLTAVMSAAFFVLVTALGGDVVALLYAKGLSAAELGLSALLLRLSGPAVLFMSMIHLATAVLQGCNKPARPALNLLLGALVKIALTALLLRVIGIYGALIGTVACYLVTAALDTVMMNRASGSALRVLPFWKLTVSCLGFAAVSVGLWFLANLFALAPLWRLVVAAPPGLAVFVGLLLWTRFFSGAELTRLIPFHHPRRKKHLNRKTAEKPAEKER
ncbi:MAG: polysaccharide biosynthesis protein [Clostridiales bacterium]|jgi:stage V sporulation protein B|nr:polysaccharide biosynthesis protein [Clostridiales bacterium]